MSGRAEARTAEIWHGVHGAQAWHLPSLEGSAGQDLPEESAAPPTAAELEQIHTAAREEGWKEGHAEGLAAGRAEAEEELRALQAIVAQLARPLEGLDTEVERALTNLSLSLARRIVGQCVEAEAENLRENAMAKLARKGCDWVVGNAVTAADGSSVFGSDSNSAMLITGNDCESWPAMSKPALAERLVDRIEAQFA